jgi:hypothetical protein
MEQEPPDLIRKLAALANHPATPPAEAAAARRKLKALLEKHNLTEEDISSERRIKWEIFYLDPWEKDLFLWVASMILDTFHVPVALRKRLKSYNAEILCGVTDKIDIEACFSYYRKILANDRNAMVHKRQTIRNEIKKLTAEAAVLAAAIKKLPTVLRHKHEIYPPQLLAKARQKRDAAAPAPAAAPPPKEKKLSAAERRKQEKDNAAYWTARRNLTEADSWQKGPGLQGDLALDFS